MAAIKEVSRPTATAATTTVTITISPLAATNAETRACSSRIATPTVPTSNQVLTSAPLATAPTSAMSNSQSTTTNAETIAANNAITTTSNSQSTTTNAETVTSNRGVITFEVIPSDKVMTSSGQSLIPMTPGVENRTLAVRTEVIVPTVEELMTDRCNLVCTATGCGKVLRGPPALRMHLIKAHGIYENPEDKDLFSNTKHNDATVNSVTVNKQYYCPIASCRRSKSRNKPFPRITLLKQHYVGIHAEKRFQCSKCPAKFGMDKLRIRHEETCGVMFKCTCAAEYKTRGALWSHAKYQKHALPPDFALRPQKQQQKELQRQQEQLQKQERLAQRRQKHLLMKQLEEQRKMNLKRMCGPLPILPKMPHNVVYAVPFPVPSHNPNVATIPCSPDVSRQRTASTQTPPIRKRRGPYKKSKKMVSKAIQSGVGHQQKQSSQQIPLISQGQSSNQLGEIVHVGQNYQESGMNTSFVSATNMQTQTSVGGFQSTHTCTQTQGDVIVRNALLSANIETQTSCSHTQLVQSSTQYSNSYVAATAETQTARPNLTLHQSTLFDLESISHPTVQTQTSATCTSVSSSDAQTDNWISALYGTPSHDSPVPDSPGSSLTQPSDVPTQTDLSFLDMLNFSHSETQTMNSLATFMTESSSTQTPNITLNQPGSSTPLQSTEAQTHMAGVAGPMPLNTSQTQTSFTDLCLGDVFLSESHSQTSPRVPFRIDDGLSSSHQQTQTGTLTGTWHQSTQTAAEKELDAALSLLNRYTQTSQTERSNGSPRPDSLSELEFTSMHTQTMEDVLAVLDNDNQSTSVQTDFDTLTGDHRSFGVSTDGRPSSSSLSNNSGVAVQTDTLDLSSFQDLDFYSNSSNSSQTS